ncbi:hypothetical protein Taro_052889, partial [Colocasia esculenta]|nr:hypothetical protein [Colocasia esculenta]
MLPSPVWNLCSSWAAPGSRISSVCLSADVAMAWRVATSEVPIGQTLVLRGKRGLDSGAESFVELSWLGLGHRGWPEFYPVQASQSFVSLPHSTLVPEPRAEAGARLASRACGLRVPLLAASSGGLVAVVVTIPVLLVVSASVFSWFRGPVCGFFASFVCALQWVVVAAASRAWRSALLLELSRYFVCSVASLVECCDTCLWLLSAWHWLVVSSCEVLPESFSVGSAGKLFAVFLGLRYAVRLASEFSQNGASVVLVEVLPGLVLPRIALCCFWWRFSPEPLRISAWALSVMVLCAWPCIWLLRWSARSVACFQVSRLHWWDYVSPWLGSFASFLVPCVLSQMVVWAGAGVACCALSGLRSFARGLGSTLCCPVCLIVRFVRRFASLLGVGGVELSASETLCAGLYLVVVTLSLWGGCFALS